jgi:HTH-type transcriptional regulator / antitoxin HipB
MKKNKINTLDDLLDYEHGKPGTPGRDKWEQEYETFKMTVILEESGKTENPNEIQIYKRN